MKIESFPYSQQIHDKILADWKNVPLELWHYDGCIISHSTIDYELVVGINELGPRNPQLNRALWLDHRQSLYEKLIARPKEELEKTQTELAAKQFLGLS